MVQNEPCPSLSSSPSSVPAYVDKYIWWSSSLKKKYPVKSLTFRKRLLCNGLTFEYFTLFSSLRKSTKTFFINVPIYLHSFVRFVWLQINTEVSKKRLAKRDRKKTLKSIRFVCPVRTLYWLTDTRLSRSDQQAELSKWQGRNWKKDVNERGNQKNRAGKGGRKNTRVGQFPHTISPQIRHLSCFY